MPKSQGGSSKPGPGPQVGPDARVRARMSASPGRLPRRAWWPVVKRTAGEFRNDGLGDRAAALTYYGILALFPALLVLVAALGVAGPSATQKVLDNLRQLTPASARQIITDAVRQLQASRATGSVLAIVGLVLAVWSASGYVAAFIRAANAVYDIPEGRPFWMVSPLRLALTLVLMVLVLAGVLIVVFTGGIAQQAGTALGVGNGGLTVWSVAKWPVLVVLVTAMIGLLYWGAPNVKERGLAWVSPGSFLALLLWLAASAGFSLYVANFASYNKTYGTLAGVIVFLVWLWLTNVALLLGLEFDAELARERAIQAGYPERKEPYVAPRDTRAWSAEQRTDAEAPSEATTTEAGGTDGQ